MNTITTETGVYTPSETDVVHHTSASLTDRWQPLPVHLLQYDQTLPIIAVDIYANGSQYEVPSGAAVNIRMDKPDGKHAYNPAKGLSSDRHTAYFEVTAQMTAAHGESSPAVEIVVNGGISGSGSFSLIQGRFLLAADSTYPAGSTGGSAVVTLTAQNIPQMTGQLGYCDSGFVPANSYARSVIKSGKGGGGTTLDGMTGSLADRDPAGYYDSPLVRMGTSSPSSISILPPYLAVYMWRRTA